MPWDQDEVEIENTSLTREELLEQIIIFSSRDEVMDYAECIAESRNDESLYYLILGIFEMLQESGTHENFQDTIQKHKDQLLTKIF